MAKIFSILTILVAAAAIYLGLEADKRAKELGDAGKKLQGTLVRTETKLKATETELDDTKKKLAATEAELATTKENLRTTQEKLTKTESELATATKELDSAKMEIAGINTILQELFPGKQIEPGNLKQTIAEMKDAVTTLTTKSKELEEKTATLEKEKAELTATVQTLEGRTKEQGDEIAEKKKVIKKYTDNIMEKGIKGRVMAVNPGWGFCVLSVGDKSGAAANKVMLVARGGQAIGRVKITNVEANQL
jgi:chromosome segregation ATPase